MADDPDPSLAETDDGEVIASSLADPERFGQIFERHFDAIHRYLARRVGGTLADDLAAQVFTIAFERRRSFGPASGPRGAGRARPWLYGLLPTWFGATSEPSGDFSGRWAG